MRKSIGIFRTFGDGLLFVVYVAFLATVGNYTYMRLELGLHWGFNLFFILALTGIPLIVGIIFDDRRYLRGFLVSVIILVSIIAYSGRIEAPAPEPEKAKAFAIDLLARVAAEDPTAQVNFDPADVYETTLNRVTGFKAENAKVVKFLQYAPSDMESRGICNAYHVYVAHEAKVTSLGIRQCYDGGTPFSVWSSWTESEAKFQNNRK
jgi:hypothetical protein